MTERELDALGRGIGEACHRASASWVGGDLTTSPGGLVIDVTVLGRTSDPVLRSGARPGHEIWVTGHLGGGAAAVAIWRDGGTPGPALVHAFARPTARVAEARWLHETVGLSALIDISDGLVGDARHLGYASDVRLSLEGFSVPVDPAATGALGVVPARAAALAGGDDYELCMTVPEGAMAEHAEAFRAHFGLALTRIGTVDRGSGVYVRSQPGGPAVEADSGAGFEHFSDEADVS